MPDDTRRPVNPQHAASTDDIVGFADGYPFLLTTTGSLAALQAEMDELVPMDRFRANIVVDHAEPWAEDEWSELRIGDVQLAAAKACTRCVITTTDQATGERGIEPLPTLKRLRRTASGVAVGIYLVPRSTGGSVHPGDALVATSR
jgi:uncharacterized protein YcbX